MRALSEYEEAVDGYMRMIVMRAEPISIVPDLEFRSFSRFKIALSLDTVRSVITKLVELVELRTTAEFSTSKGALIFDGWTALRTNFIAMLFSYCVPIEVHVNYLTRKEYRNQLTLMAVSPMANCENSGEFSDNATNLFNVEEHLQFFRENFTFFGNSFDNWVLCLISDNC